MHAHDTGDTSTSADGRVTPLRPVVADSWRRSQLSGLEPDRVERRLCDVDTDSKFLHQVRPALESLAKRLSGTDTSVVIGDARGRIVWQWAENPGHQRMLERHLVVVGSDHSEERLGTNGVGTALEINRPVAIVGEEHFAHEMRDFACHAATVRHPLTRRVVGVANITSAARKSSPLLGSVLLGVVEDMERLLTESASPAEHELLTRFLLARRRAKRPVVTIGEDFLVANQSAMRLGISQGLLWQEILAGGGADSRNFPLPGHEHVLADAQIVRDGSAILGAVVILRDEQEPTAAIPRPRTSGGTAPPRDLLTEATRSAVRRGRLLVTGETGTGKRTLLADVARRMEAQPTVVDAAIAPVDGAELWLKRIRRLVDGGSGAVLVQHIDGLPPAMLTSLMAVLGEERGSTPLVLATAASPSPALLNAFGTAQVEIPPLRTRVADIPELVTRMCRIHEPERPVRFSMDALELLQAYDWPGNVRQLDDLVRETVGSTPAVVIGAADLPLQVRNGIRSNLSPLEEAEAAVIARVLDESRGNKKLAAQRLQIARGSLYQKMRRYRIVGA